MGGGFLGGIKGTQGSIRYPGNDPGKSPGDGFSWRGKGTPSSGFGSWYNPDTGETWHPDLGHNAPVGPHWDYTNSDGTKYRVYPDGRVEKK